MACGLTIDIDNIDDFSLFLNNKICNKDVNTNRPHWIDLSIAVKGASVEMLRQFKNAEPFGAGNPEPIFLIKNAIVFNAKIVGENHIRCDISDSSNSRIGAIAFRSKETNLGKTILKNNKLHLIGKLKISEWNNKEHVQMHIMDVIKL